MTAPNLARDLLDDLAEIISNPLMTAEKKRECIWIAYQIGLSDGRVEGAKSMGEHMCSTLNTHLKTVEVAS